MRSRTTLLFGAVYYGTGDYLGDKNFAWRNFASRKACVGIFVSRLSSLTRRSPAERISLIEERVCVVCEIVRRLFHQLEKRIRPCDARVHLFRIAFFGRRLIHKSLIVQRVFFERARRLSAERNCILVSFFR